MGRQLSTSLSDLVLALSCVHCVRILLTNGQLLGQNYSYAVGYLTLVFVAACLGVVRFGSSSPVRVLVRCHMGASYLASVIGLSVLACEFYRQTDFPHFGQFHTYAALAVLLSWLVVDYKTHHTLSEFVSSAAVLSVALVCALHRNVYGCLGAAVIIFSGLFVGTHGRSRLGLPAVDLFHYGLVLANYFLVQALLKSA